MSSLTMLQLFSRLLLLLCIASMVSSSPRPHFGEVNPTDQESTGFLESSNLSNEQMEQLVQKLLEYNNRYPGYPSAWERLLKSPEMKRQSRFRQCYFNPVSCFKK
ncbi:uncharacterized protein [Onthophagus taurus]|uniref:uncharacterized protein n=1 Tax=Onthophagus taurus TaxID=166361 RepID=UPI0039BDADB4